MVIIFGPAKGIFDCQDNPVLTEPGVGIPGDGEDMREELSLDPCEGICLSFDIPLDAVVAGAAPRAPQAIGIAAATRGFGPPPKAGNSSSERTSNTGAFVVFGFKTGASGLVLEMDSSSTVAEPVLRLLTGLESDTFPFFTASDGGGCWISSSSTTSSTVAR